MPGRSSASGATAARRPEGAVPVPETSAVREALKEAARLYYGWYERLAGPFDYLIILAHMRSGSSLLAHLLASHREILGFGETHTRYTSARQFHLMTAKVARTLLRPPYLPRSRYLLDKVLHDTLTPAPSLHLLADPRVHIVYLIRQPAGALSSLMRSFGLGEAEALKRYTARLATLGSYGDRLEAAASRTFVTYDDLLWRTGAVFSLLERQLALSHPLSEHYRILPTTGRRVVGDWTAHIRRGRIVRKRPVGLTACSDDALRVARDAFSECRASLESRASHIEPSGGHRERTSSRLGDAALLPGC